MDRVLTSAFTMRIISVFQPAAIFVGLSTFLHLAAAQTLPPPAEDPNRPPGLKLRPGTTNSWYDADGNIYVRAGTGRWSNYDENKAGNYTLPDPLVLNNGQPVRDSRTWLRQRRPEILNAYLTELFGHIPKHAPKVRFEVLNVETNALGGAAIMKTIIGHIDGTTHSSINFKLYLPVKARGPVPVIVTVGPGVMPAIRPGSSNAASRLAAFRYGGAPIEEVLARGWGFADVGVYAIQPDNDGFTNGVIGLTLPPGATHPAPDEWGVIGAWSWGLSRVLDYFETDSAVDAKHVALEGHSRWGKTVLWTMAREPRFALVYASCSGEMGAALSRRDWGETIDNMAGGLRYQFAGNFVKYAGHWNDLPVDAHELIALSAPRPVFITGGSQDQWADPHGEFLAEVAAGPVYRLLGRKDLGTTNMPSLDVVVDTGELAFKEHTGGHAATTADWQDFLKFAERYFPVAKN